MKITPVRRLLALCGIAVGLILAVAVAPIVANNNVHNVNDLTGYYVQKPMGNPDADYDVYTLRVGYSFKYTGGNLGLSSNNSTLGSTLFMVNWTKGIAPIWDINYTFANVEYSWTYGPRTTTSEKYAWGSYTIRRFDIESEKINGSVKLISEPTMDHYTFEGTLKGNANEEFVLWLRVEPSKISVFDCETNSFGTSGTTETKCKASLEPPYYYVATIDLTANDGLGFYQSEIYDEAFIR